MKKYNSYLCELQLIKHLKVNLLDEVPGQINSADPCDRAKGSSAHVVNLIIAQE